MLEEWGTFQVSEREIERRRHFIIQLMWYCACTRKGEFEKEKDFSSYVGRYINLCWTNWPCWGDNVTAGVSAATAKINPK